MTVFSQDILWQQGPLTSSENILYIYNYIYQLFTSFEASNRRLSLVARLAKVRASGESLA